MFSAREGYGIVGGIVVGAVVGDFMYPPDKYKKRQNVLVAVAGGFLGFILASTTAPAPLPPTTPTA